MRRATDRIGELGAPQDVAKAYLDLIKIKGELEEAHRGHAPVCFLVDEESREYLGLVTARGLGHCIQYYLEKIEEALWGLITKGEVFPFLRRQEKEADSEQGRGGTELCVGGDND